MIEAIAFATLYVAGGMLMAMVIETDMSDMSWSAKAVMITFWPILTVYSYITALFIDE